MSNFSIPYGRQSIDQADIDAVVSTLTQDFLTQGPKVSEFEEKFAGYIGSKYAVACANGTAALHLCALALDVQPGDRVITTPITFAASSNCISYCGGKIEFADIDPKTALLDINAVKAKLANKPKGYYKGVIPVDFAGQGVDLESFRKLCDEHDLWMIEDSCHSPGGSFTDSQGITQNCGNGNFADLAIFSFHPVKHIACGEGGMITTNSKELYDKLCVLRTHGITRNPELLEENHGGWYYDMVSLGYNYRIPDILCALGISQLAKAESGIKRRREIAKKYDVAFKDTSVKPLKINEGVNHAYHLYTVLLNNRKEVYDTLRKNGIYAQVHYIPTHLLKYYRSKGHKKGDYPLAEAYYEQCLSLPMYPTLKEEEQAYVIEQVLNISA